MVPSINSQSCHTHLLNSLMKMQHHYRNGSPDGQPVPLAEDAFAQRCLPWFATFSFYQCSQFDQSFSCLNQMLLPSCSISVVQDHFSFFFNCKSAFYGDLKPSDSSPTFLKPIIREISVVRARSNGNTSRHFLHITQLFARRHCYNVGKMFFV